MIVNDSFAVALQSEDFASGSLPVNSYIRPTRIFTADKNIIVRRSGTVKTFVFNIVVQKIIALLK